MTNFPLVDFYFHVIFVPVVVSYRFSFSPSPLTFSSSKLLSCFLWRSFGRWWRSAEHMQDGPEPYTASSQLFSYDLTLSFLCLSFVDPSFLGKHPPRDFKKYLVRQ